jgi:hypothetical protein
MAWAAVIFGQKRAGRFAQRSRAELHSKLVRRWRIAFVYRGNDSATAMRKTIWRCSSSISGIRWRWRWSRSSPVIGMRSPAQMATSSLLSTPSHSYVVMLIIRPVLETGMLKAFELETATKSLWRGPMAWARLFSARREPVGSRNAAGAIAFEACPPGAARFR